MIKEKIIQLSITPEVMLCRIPISKRFNLGPFCTQQQMEKRECAMVLGEGSFEDKAIGEEVAVIINNSRLVRYNVEQIE